MRNLMRNLKKIWSTKLFSEELGIELKSKEPEAVWKWLLASFLFGKRISIQTASKTFKVFEKHGLVNSKAILKAGWQKLVEVLDEGGYTRYDFSTADRLLDLAKKFDELKLFELLKKPQIEIEKELKQVKGIGKVTINIFLRELRPFWPNINPKPLFFIKKLAKIYGINLDKIKDREKLSRIEAWLIKRKKLKLKRKNKE